MMNKIARSVAAKEKDKQMYDFAAQPNSLEEFWMPFTNQRGWKKDPKMLVRAEGMYYYDQSGREILDGAAGLWCVNAGHGVERIKEAVIEQMNMMDFAPSFRFGHPAAFRAASRVVGMMPDHISNVFSAIPAPKRWRRRSRLRWPITAPAGRHAPLAYWPPARLSRGRLCRYFGGRYSL